MARSEALFGALLLALGGCSLVLDADDHRDGVVADGGGRDMTVRDDMSSPDMNVPGDDMNLPDTSVPHDMPHSLCGALSLRGGASADTAVSASGQYDDMEEMTLETWVYVSETAGNRNVVGHWRTNQVSGGYAIYLNGANPAFAVSCNGDDFYHARSGTEIQANRWTHLAGTFEATGSSATLRIFVDGTLETTVTAPCETPNPLPATPLQIAYDDPGINGGNPMEGYVDEVRLSAEVRYAENFDPAIRFISDSSTRALFHFEEPEPLSDASPVPSDLTASGGAAHAPATCPGDP
ncbi:MAG: hypothetical protein CMN30_02005 [Sandaracinus sp.]|nr:hypothetical protein [Sandaracinus sp.]